MNPNCAPNAKDCGAQAQSASCIGLTCPQREKEQTVGEAMDSSIEAARQRVLDLCIKKAKLEAMNLLDHPMQKMRELFDVYPF